MGDSFTYGYVDGRRTTEWEDILVEKGIIHEDARVKFTRLAKEEALSRTEVEQVDRTGKLLKDEFEGKQKNMKELDECEADGCDEDVLKKLRETRIQQLKQEKLKNRFGECLEITRDEFIREVTNASKEPGLSVIVELYQERIENSRVMSEYFKKLAQLCPSRKFVRIVADKCVDKWPDDKVPSIFIYQDGVMKHHIDGLKFCNGVKFLNEQTLAKALEENGALKVAFDVHFPNSTTRKPAFDEEEEDDEDDDW